MNQNKMNQNKKKIDIKIDLEKKIDKIEENEEEILLLKKSLKFETSWTFYDHEKSTNTDYDKSTRMIGSFDNIIDFWSFFNNIPGPSSLFYQKEHGKPYYIYKDKKREISSISLFRSGIEPKWEDPKNINGSEISLRKFYNKDLPPIVFLDNLWLNLIVSCIGEQFSKSEDITGCRVVDSSIIISGKPLYRIELWFSSQKTPEEINQLDLQFKSFLKLTSNDKLLYNIHEITEKIGKNL